MLKADSARNRLTGIALVSLWFTRGLPTSSVQVEPGAEPAPATSS